MAKWNADGMLAAMTAKAEELGVAGVMVVARMDAAGESWESQMRVLGRSKLVHAKPDEHGFAGCNFIAVAYSKAAEMADTKEDSGGGARAVYQGEFGYPGGVIAARDGGYVLAVFSGATGEQDTEISRAGMAALG